MDIKNCFAFFNMLMSVCTCVSRGESMTWLNDSAFEQLLRAVGRRGRCGREETGPLSWLDKIMR